MYLKGSKIIAILCISVIISCHKVLSTSNGSRVQGNKGNSYELNILNEFLDYNRLHNAIIIKDYTLTWPDRRYSKGCPSKSTDIGMMKFIMQPLIQKLTEDYHMQFVNSLMATGYDYLLSSPTTRQVLIFMKYNPQDKEKQKILQLASQKEKFNSQFVWLLIMEEIDEPHHLEIESLFGHLNLMLNTDFTVAVRSRSNDYHYDFYDIYKICHYCGSPLEIEYKGNWTVGKGLYILNKFRDGIAFRRNNLKKFGIKAATAILNKSPDLNVSELDYLNNDKEHLEEDAMQRKTFQLMNHMLYLYNATFDVKIESSWGAEENGSWTGVIGLLHRHEAELSLCPLRYLLKRTKVLVYTMNIHYEKIHFIFRHPKHTSIRNIFFEPLADFVWWCVLALIIVTILLLAIHVHIEYKLFTTMQAQQQNSAHSLIANNASASTFNAAPIQFHSGLMIVENHFDFIVLCIMEAILMQGPAPELFRCNSTRLLLLSVSIFSILLMQFYGAFIVSSLLSEPPRSITNLQALYNSSLELGMEDVSYNYDVFINNTNPLIHNLYKYRICHKSSSSSTHCRNVMSLEEGVRRIGAGNFAFHVAIDRAYRLLKSSLTESQFCDLQEIMFNPPYTFYSALGIRKQSPYYEFITRAIIIFQESALVPYNDKKWVVNKIDCSAIGGDQVEVDLEHFAPALAFLLLAYIMSLLALFVEIVYRKFLQKKNLIFFN